MTKSTTSNFDCIVIGGGHNGLTFAAMRAKAGKKVLLLEKKDVLGGVAASEEFHPGFKTAGLLHDTSQVRSKVISELSLENFGLRTYREKPPVFLPSKEGGGIMLFDEPEKTAKSLSKFCDSDVKAYVDYRAFVQKAKKAFQKFVNSPPHATTQPQLSKILELLRSALAIRLMGKKEMMEILRIFPMSAQDFLSERFSCELLKAGLSAPAVAGNYLGPYSPGSATNLLFAEIATQHAIVGGPHALVSALTKAALSFGVNIKKSSEVKNIHLEGDSARAVELSDKTTYTAPLIASSLDPKTTFHSLVDPFCIDHNFDQRLQNFRTRGVSAKVNLAIDGGLCFKELKGDTSLFSKVAYSPSYIEKAFDAIKYGQAAKNPMLDVYVPSLEDHTLAPKGKNVVSILVHFAPFDLKDGWSNNTKKDLFDSTLRILSTHAPDLPKQILAYQILSPVDLKERYSLPDGHIFHGEHSIDQLLIRPTPECARYKTPLRGLILCGSGSFPGGGISCAPGYLASEAL